MFCSNCGKEITDEVKFCSYCGNPTQITGTATDTAKLEPKDKTKKTASKVKEMVGNAVGAGIGIAAGLLVLFIPLALIFGVIPAAIIVAAGIVYELWQKSGGRHPVRLLIAAVIIVTQVIFLYEANHNSKAVNAVQNAQARGDGMTFGSFAASTLGSAKWLTIGVPSGSTYHVMLKGKLLNTQTGKKLKTKVKFSVSNIWNIDETADVEIDSVYIKTFGNGNEAKQAFNRLLYSVD